MAGGSGTPRRRRRRRPQQRIQEEPNNAGGARAEQQQQGATAIARKRGTTTTSNKKTPFFVLNLWLAGFVMLLALISVRFFSINDEFEEQLPPAAAEVGATTSSPWDWHETEPDLKPMTVDFLDKDRNETFWAYVTPDVARFYRKVPGSLQVREPSFPGQYAKFVNLSPQKVELFYAPGAGKPGVHMAYIDPFDVAGKSPKPGLQFFLTPIGNPKDVLIVWQVEKGKNLLVYDPLEGQDASEKLTEKELKRYIIQKENLLFADAYRRITGRDWLALYGYQKPPKYPLWRADYFGQTHVVRTEETHFTAVPPENKIKPFTPVRSKPRQLPEYRSPETLNLTLEVLSCSPRVFEIDNFLSDVEADHILQFSADMKASVTHNEKGRIFGRSSENTWVARGSSLVVDAIYRRAADLLRIDEALMRRRSKDEGVDLEPASAYITESLQLVHYGVGEEYRPHHDFRAASIGDKDQRMRYATLLFYLNDDMTGGETSFPRYMNAETEDALKVTPKKGKAVLFYDLLPDGNMDDRSHHAGLPVLSGEKWLANLWVWSPYSELH